MTETEIIDTVKAEWNSIDAQLSKFKLKKRISYMCYYLLRVKLELHIRYIAKAFGCTYPTVIYGTSVHRKLLKGNVEYRQVFESVSKRLL